MPLERVNFSLGGRSWTADLQNAHDLSRPLDFSGKRDSWFGSPPAQSIPLRTEGFVGQVSQGGAVNVSILSFAPHCTGTHTESIGHLTTEPRPLSSVCIGGLIPATLVTLAHVSVAAMSECLAGQDPFLDALVIRRENGPLTYEPAGLALAAKLGVTHLVVEDVSVDPERDEGRLAAHRAWWDLEPGSNSGWSSRTITELAVVPSAAADGPYLLNLQVPHLVTDAVPSRPVLYPVTAR